jgi:sulfate-transporting ATPase
VTSLFAYLLLSLPLIGAYAMLAIGIVVVFRASRVLNLAHGAMAMLPAYLAYQLNKAGIPALIAVVLAVAAAAGFGAGVERFFVRPLARQGPTAQTVGTVAVYGVTVAVSAQIWGSSSRQSLHLFPAGELKIAGTGVAWGQLGLFVIALVCAAGFVALFRYTEIGLGMRGSAQNQRAAALMGINPNTMARTAWMLGGGLAGLAGILLASVTNLQPYTLSLQMLPAFVAALIGGLENLPGGVWGAFVVGGAQGLVPAFSLVPGLRKWAEQVGMPQLVLTVVAFVAMYVRGGRFSVGDGRASLAGSGEARPTHTAFAPGLVEPPHGRRRGVRFVVLAALAVWPMLGLPSFLHPLNTFSILGDAILAGQYFLVAASIVMLTGWVGQISLAQATFVGIGGFGSALLSRRFGISFPFSFPVAAALGAGASALLGVVALRVRGLYLAVATLIFAWMADAYLFIVPWFAGVGGSATAHAPALGKKGTFPYFDFTDRRTFYYVMLAICAAAMFGLLSLRDSKTGRAFFAVRGSEAAAASLGIDIVKYKLLAFAVAGGIAGMAGNLLLAHQVTIVPAQFSLPMSLLFLSVAIVGGLRSLQGAIGASVLFAALAELFFRVPSLGSYLQLISASLLAVMLLVYPGGLAALPQSVERLRRRLPRLPQERLAAAAKPLLERVQAVWANARRRLSEIRLPSSVAEKLPARRSVSVRTTGLVARGRFARVTQRSKDTAAPARTSPDVVQASDVNGAAPARPVSPAEGFGPRFDWDGTVLEAKGITVRFGGLTAVEDASLRVEASQIVGLIGPNGAGKTTFFNAISGLNRPTAGTVSLFGEDVTSLPVHERAARGLGRTFQVIQLFPELTVFENLLVATHLHNPSGVVSHVLVTARAVESELLAEETCRRVIRFLRLEEIADRPVAGLPFGTLRNVEIGRALVTGSPFVMLDEPASGLDNAETDKLSELLLFVRAELGLSILLIEHDVRMVTGVSDYMYVLTRGRMLAEGRPAEVQHNPDVEAAYLGQAPEPAPMMA